MSLGYDINVDNRTFEQEGITGNVKRFPVEKMMFPNLILINSKDNRIAQHRVKVLPQMFMSTSCEGDTTNPIGVYFKEEERVLYLGKIFPRQVRSFLRLFAGNDIVGFVDKDTKLVDDYLYVLME